MARTSASDPIRVDFVAQDALGLPGRLGLTIAPAKKDLSGGWDRDLEADIARLRDEYRARLLVSLVEDSELALLGIEQLVWAARDAGLSVHRLAVPDAGVPRDVDAVVALVRIVLAVAEAGDAVVIHCRGGLGRSGLVATCCLVARGHAPVDAVTIVRMARRGAVETSAQERFILRFADALKHADPIVPAVSRFTGCLLGGALGDALGYPVEFLTTASEIERVLGPVTPERLPRARGGKALVSDDTQMTLFTAEGLIRAAHRAVDRGICSTEGVLMRAYQRWHSTQSGGGAAEWSDKNARGWLLGVPELHAARAPGNTCMSAIARSLRADRLPSVDAPPNDSKGCGAVMRSAPIGLVAADARGAFEMARDAAVLTHGHPSGYLSAAYFAAVIQGVSRDVSLPEAMARADELLEGERGRGEVRTAVVRARELAREGAPSASRIERLGGGWVGEEALAIALLCARSLKEVGPDAVRVALWRAVAHGGDSDSTGSLTGNLLGAMHGAEVLPREWLADLELRETIERVARHLHLVCLLRLLPDPLTYPPN